jgi:mannose-6-phosphate isomerase-like protein (cupin superfamily)
MTVTPGDNVEFVDLPGRSSGDPLWSVDAASSVRVARLHRSERRLAHRHPQSEEVIYVRRGTGTIYIEGIRNAIGPGDTVYIPPGAAHATIPDSGEEMELICFFPHPRLSENLEETDIDVMTVADE